MHFLLRTDQKSLTYINFAVSAKVYRWKLSVQAFDFDTEHIHGKDNVEADVLLRLCPLIEDPEKDVVNSNRDANGRRSSSYDKYLDDYGRIPRQALQTILQFHNEHGGVERTILCMGNITKVEKLDHRRKHVEYYIRYLCPCCQKMSQLKPFIHANPFVTSEFNILTGG